MPASDSLVSDLTYGQQAAYNRGTYNWISLIHKGMDSFIRRADNFEKQEAKVSDKTLKAITKAFAEEARLEAPFWTGLLSSSHTWDYQPGNIPTGFWPFGRVHLEPRMHPILPELTTIYGPRYHMTYPWFLITITGAGDSIMQEYGADFAQPYLDLFKSERGGPLGIF